MEKFWGEVLPWLLFCVMDPRINIAMMIFQLDAGLELRESSMCKSQMMINVQIIYILF